ncbi:MAG: SusD/RagB family nutrient-binding outer membrane lipoprotein [Allomuricauda sp.]|jgi:Starch-binding associating with outer membrane/Susd and RagB outer membrane lipoprotein
MNKKYINNYLKGLLVILTVVLGSCESTELEILNDPNALNADQSDIDFFMNSIQYDVSRLVQGNPLTPFGLSEAGMEITRITHMFGPDYRSAYGGTAFDPQWQAVYSSALPDIRTMTPLAEEQGLYMHIGMAKVLEAYMMMDMVDFFGDVPYSEATQGVEFPNPNVDSGADIYIALESLLNEAITEFGKTETSKPTNDIYYGGDKSKWIKLANTLKLKMYVQSRLVDSSVKAKIDALIAQGNFITSANEDFVFQYSSTDSNPDSRHPEFSANFDAGTGEYMSTSYMYDLVKRKNVEDPRWRYYIYRQSSTNTTDVNEQSCITQNRPIHYVPSDIWCNFSDEGFWGRVHGDGDGIPPDNGKRTTYGLYPVGGLFDNDSYISITGRNISTKGSGILPLMLSSFVDFMLAESALTMGTSGDARTYLESGIRKSISKVMNFSPENVDEAFVPSTAAVDNYVDTVLSIYDGAASDDEKLDIIIKEYFLALFGNGIEAYNTYRRTGKPSNLQSTKISAPGDFIRSFFYPQTFVSQNSNVGQKVDQSVQVFWDNNPAGFIK